MNASGGVPGCAMIKSDMYEKYERWLCHKYYVNYMIMQSNMTMMVCVIINGTVELHGNISQNGYGNAIIGRYGGYFEEGIRRVLCTGECYAPLEWLERWKGESVYNPWTQH